MRVNLTGWLVVVLLAGLTEASVRLFDLHDSVAAPSATLRALVRELSSGALSREVATTLESYVQGFGIACVIGVVVGTAIGSSRILRDASSIVIELLRPIPAVAFIPLAFMVFGLGVPMRRFVIAYAALWPILVNTLYAVRGSEPMLRDVARTSGATRLGTLVRVTLPAALPGIAAGLRVSAAIALLAGVTVEFVTLTGGIGAYMQRQQLAFHLPEMYAAILLTALLGYAISIALRVTERRVLFWVGEERVSQ